MRNCFATVLFAFIIAALPGCRQKPEQHAAQPPDPHQLLGQRISESLKAGLMEGWQLTTLEECAVPPGWIGNGEKGWHAVIVSPDTEAGPQTCHFWIFPADWTGQKKALPPASEVATAFYYCQGDDMMLFTQPPEDPAMTQIAVSQVAQALVIPDARGEMSMRTPERIKKIRAQLLAAAGANSATLEKIVNRVIESRYAVSAFTSGCSDEEAATLVKALRQTFPEKRTFIIHRNGTDYQDSIIVSGTR
jgi:hypothetical protein